MQKVKQLNFDSLYPILEVNDECIISKSGDITFAYEVILPEKNSLTADDYSHLRQIIERAYNILPVGTIILKQDIYFKDNYQHSLSEGEKGSFLLSSYANHFQGREFTSHKAMLYFTMPNKGRYNVSSLYSILTKRYVVMDKHVNSVFTSFTDAVSQVINILTSDKSLLKLRKCTPNEINAIISQTINFCAQEQAIIHDYVVRPDYFKVGNREIYNLSLTSLKHDMPHDFEENVIDRSLSTDTTTLYSSVLSQVGYNIKSNHIVNHYIKIVDNDQELSSLSTRSRFLHSFGSLSAENALNYEHIEQYMQDSAESKVQTVKCSVQILVDDHNEINNLVTALLKQGFRLRQNIYNAPIPLWSSIPGNAADLPKEEYMTMSLRTAVALSSLEMASQGIKGGKFSLCERTTNTPIDLDISTVALDKDYISNYNIFTLGPSGSGKSFFTNEYMMQAYYREHAHCVIIDQGNSYFPLCQIVKEESGGQDGIYFNADDYPFSFNPFLSLTGDEEKDQEDVTFIRSLLFCMIRNPNPSAVEMSIISEMIHEYSQSTYERSLRGFRSFIRTVYAKSHAEDIADCQFNIKGLLKVLNGFCRKDKYGKLLNNPANIDLTTNRFILFEIDSIAGDEVLFPIITMLITKLFADKMKSISVSERKIMLIEEAWRAIASPQMAEWIQWLWKTARKHNAQAIVVTQEVEDIISSPVVKQAIINNSSTKILLDQSKLKDKYDEIAAVMSLSQQDKNLVFSINKDTNSKYVYREVFIALGTDKKYVYGVETSRQEYWAYTTKPAEKDRLRKEVAKTGSYIEAIKNLTKK